ncbi:Thioredoxin reductase [Paenibacillus konkukensis]|uniref:Thioredoxin reductase n=1 Tax=Paenibacillus konkukensis TaxID=2020716 RepID=A0ABY4RFT5_9BACL|nr:NAD(P)/FAD-dependent oxidoreductase [Paenibacillus konkukensis]UQZ80876.1 Thioredoxin reductase [Paenibacillus konkukensis]
MLLDCVIVGGGPAGLNAALVLGRARRNVLLFDNNKPRNAVTHESHGFLTRDGVKPEQFRRIAHEEIMKYPSVRMKQATVTDIRHHGGGFEITAQSGERAAARKLILATGLREEFPPIAGFTQFYGRSLFNCPYCDGWELRDRPLVVVSEGANLFHSAMLIYNWSRNLLLCTNGRAVLSFDQKQALERKGLLVIEQPIAAFEGTDGQLEKVRFQDGSAVARAGGFVTPHWIQAAPFGARLGCATSELGGFVTDAFGRTNVKGVYAAGDTSVVAPSQLVIAAAEGSRAAIGVNGDLSFEEYTY